MLLYIFLNAYFKNNKFFILNEFDKNILLLYLSNNILSQNKCSILIMAYMTGDSKIIRSIGARQHRVQNELSSAKISHIFARVFINHIAVIIFLIIKKQSVQEQKNGADW